MFYPMIIFGIGCMVQLIAVQLFYKKTEMLSKHNDNIKILHDFLYLYHLTY